MRLRGIEGIGGIIVRVVMWNVSECVLLVMVLVMAMGMVIVRVVKENLEVKNLGVTEIDY